MDSSIPFTSRFKNFSHLGIFPHLNYSFYCRKKMDVSKKHMCGCMCIYTLFLKEWRRNISRNKKDVCKDSFSLNKLGMFYNLDMHSGMYRNNELVNLKCVLAILKSEENSCKHLSNDNVININEAQKTRRIKPINNSVKSTEMWREGYILMKNNFFNLSRNKIKQSPSYIYKDTLSFFIMRTNKSFFNEFEKFIKKIHLNKRSIERIMKITKEPEAIYPITREGYFNERGSFRSLGNQIFDKKGFDKHYRKILRKVNKKGFISKKAYIEAAIQERRHKHLSKFRKIDEEIHGMGRKSREILKSSREQHSIGKPILKKEIEIFGMGLEETEHTTFFAISNAFKVFLRHERSQYSQIDESQYVPKVKMLKTYDKIHFFKVPLLDTYKRPTKCGKSKKWNRLIQLLRYMYLRIPYYMKCYGQLISIGGTHFESITENGMSYAYCLWMKTYLEKQFGMIVKMCYDMPLKGRNNKVPLPTLYAMPDAMKPQTKTVCLFCFLEPYNELYEEVIHEAPLKNIPNKQIYFSISSSNLKYSLLIWLSSLDAYNKREGKLPCNIKLVVYPFLIYDSNLMAELVGKHENFFRDVHVFIQGNGTASLRTDPSILYSSIGTCNFQLRISYPKEDQKIKLNDESRLMVEKQLFKILCRIGRWCKRNLDGKKRLKECLEADKDQAYLHSFSVGEESLEKIFQGASMKLNFGTIKYIRGDNQKDIVETKFCILYLIRSYLNAIKEKVYEIVQCANTDFSKNHNYSIDILLEYYSHPWRTLRKASVNAIVRRAYYEVNKKGSKPELCILPMPIAEILQSRFRKAVLALGLVNNAFLMSDSLIRKQRSDSINLVAAIIVAFSKDRYFLRAALPAIGNEYKKIGFNIREIVQKHFNLGCIKIAAYKNIAIDSAKAEVVGHLNTEKLSPSHQDYQGLKDKEPKIFDSFNNEHIVKYILEYTSFNGNIYTASWLPGNLSELYNSYIDQASEIENGTKHEADSIGSYKRIIFLKLLQFKKFRSDTLRKFSKFYDVKVNPSLNNYLEEKEEIEFKIIKQGITTYFTSFDKLCNTIDTNIFSRLGKAIKLKSNSQNHSLNQYFRSIISQSMHVNKYETCFGPEILYSGTESDEEALSGAENFLPQSNKSLGANNRMTDKFGVIKKSRIDFTKDMVIEMLKRGSHIEWLEALRKFTKNDLVERAEGIEKAVFVNDISSKIVSKPGEHALTELSKPIEARNLLQGEMQKNLKKNKTHTNKDFRKQDGLPLVSMKDRYLPQDGRNDSISRSTKITPSGSREIRATKRSNKMIRKLMEACSRYRTKLVPLKSDTSFLKRVKKIGRKIYIDGETGSDIDLLFNQILHDILVINNNSLEYNLMNKILNLEKKFIKTESKTAISIDYSYYYQFFNLYRHEILELLRNYKNFSIFNVIKLPEELQEVILEKMSNPNVIRSFRAAKQNACRTSMDLINNKSTTHDFKTCSGDSSISKNVYERLISNTPTNEGSNVHHNPSQWNLFFKYLKTKCYLVVRCFGYLYRFYKTKFLEINRRINNFTYSSLNRGKTKVGYRNFLSIHLAFSSAIARFYFKLLRKIQEIEEKNFQKPKFFDNEWYDLLLMAIPSPKKPPKFRILLKKINIPKRGGRVEVGYNGEWKNIFQLAVLLRMHARKLLREKTIRGHLQNMFFQKYEKLQRKYERIKYLACEVKQMNKANQTSFLFDWIELMGISLKQCDRLKLGVPKTRLKAYVIFPVTKMVLNRKVVTLEWKRFYKHCDFKYDQIISLLQNVFKIPKKNILTNNKIDEVFESKGEIHNQSPQTDSKMHISTNDSLTRIIGCPVSNFLIPVVAGSGQIPVLQKDLLALSDEDFRKSLKSDEKVVRPYRERNLIKCFHFLLRTAGTFRRIWYFIRKINAIKKQNLFKFKKTILHDNFEELEYKAEKYFKNLFQMFFDVSWLLFKINRAYKRRNIVLPTVWERDINKHMCLFFVEEMVHKILKRKNDISSVFQERDPINLINLNQFYCLARQNPISAEGIVRILSNWKEVDFHHIGQVANNVMALITKLEQKKKFFFEMEHLCDTFKEKVRKHLAIKVSFYLNTYIPLFTKNVEKYQYFFEKVKRRIISMHCFKSDSEQWAPCFTSISKSRFFHLGQFKIFSDKIDSKFKKFNPIVKCINRKSAAKKIGAEKFLENFELMIKGVKNKKMAIRYGRNRLQERRYFQKFDIDILNKKINGIVQKNTFKGKTINKNATKLNVLTLKDKFFINLPKKKKKVRPFQMD